MILEIYMGKFSNKDRSLLFRIIQVLMYSYYSKIFEVENLCNFPCSKYCLTGNMQINTNPTNTNIVAKMSAVMKTYDCLSENPPC